MKLTLLLGVRGRILARQHAHEADVVGAVSDDLERLHEAREPIALDRHLLFDLGGGLRGAGILDGSGRLRGSGLGGARVARGIFRGGSHVVTGRLRGNLLRRRLGRSRFGGHGSGLARSFARWLRRLRGRALGGDHGLGRLRVDGSGLRIRSGRLGLGG